MFHNWETTSQERLSSGIQAVPRFDVRTVISNGERGILKIATDKDTDRALAKEIVAGVLVPRLTQEIKVPDILAIGRYNGHLYSITEEVQAPLATIGSSEIDEQSTVDTASSALTALIVLERHPLVKVLRIATGSSHDLTGKVRYYASVLQELSHFNPDKASELRRLLSELLERKPHVLTLATNHGDVTPWHMYKNCGGHPCKAPVLIDWENFSLKNNYLGWDLAHFYA